jgi:hypothetical protein
VGIAAADGPRAVTVPACGRRAVLVAVIAVALVDDVVRLANGESLVTKGFGAGSIATIVGQLRCVTRLAGGLTLGSLCV